MWLVAVALAAGCSPRERSFAVIARAAERTPATIVIDDLTVEVAPLREAVKGLCQARLEAATDAKTARATYDRRADVGVDTTVRILGRSYSRVASSMTEVVERVQAVRVTEAGAPVTLADDLARLAQLTRDGLARLGVTTSPCER